MKFQDLLTREEYLHSNLMPCDDINHITYLPEKCTSNSLLVIPNSQKIPTLFNTRPRAILCEESAKIPCGINTVRVSNVRKAIAEVYSRFEEINYSAFKIIGITGTNGKTSTATFIAHIAMECGLKIGSIGTGSIKIGDNEISDPYYSMTTPDPWILYPALKKMELAGCQLVIMEVSSHALELDKVSPITFDYALFTNLSSEHLDFHQTFDSYFAAKAKLFKICRCAIINIDDYYGRQLVHDCKSETKTIGVLWRGDAYASGIEDMGLKGVSYLYRGKTFSFIARLQTAGIYNVYNSMLAITVCAELGLKPFEIKNAIRSLQSISGRYEIIKDEILVIIDYAHTDKALECLLKSIRSTMKTSQKLKVVFGCGGNRDKSKRARMGAAAELQADEVILTADNSRSERTEDIIRDILSGFKGSNYKIIDDRTKAITDTILCASSEDIIAVIGKGSERYNINADGYHPYDERKIIRNALELRRSGGNK